MKKHLFLTALVLALVMCFSLGVCAHEQGNVVTTGADDPNQYVITDALKNFEPTADLWIGTLDQWKEAGNAVGDTGTIFINGEGIHGDDIIITNGVVGIVLAVETRNPWGYPAGSILDAGRVTANGSDWVGGRDTIWAAEVLVNGWDSWSPNNCGVVTFDLVNYDFEAKAESEKGIPAVKVDRDYVVGGLDMSVVTYYSIAPDAEYAYMYDQMTNNADEATPSLSNRFAVTNKGDDGGAMFGGSLNTTTGAYAGMIASYGDNEKNTFYTAMIMPGKVERFNSVTGEKLEGVVEPSRIGGSVGYKCVRVDSKGNFSDGVNKFDVFQPKETRTYNTFIYIDDVASPEGALGLIADFRGDETIKVAGTAEPNATVIVEKGGNAFGWYLADKDGKFAFELPAADDYVAYTEVLGKSFGEEVAIPAAGSEKLELKSGDAKVEVTINLKDQNGNPVYGKVEVFDGKGNSLYPTVRYNGDSVFQAEEKGVIKAEVCKGEFIAAVFGQGYWFYSNPVELKGDSTKKTEYDVTIKMEYALADGWLSGDNHHHGDKNDAFAAVEDLVPSFAASDVDVMFVTDHDFTTNNYKAYQLADDYGIEGFVPSEEISCSWAHFNVIPYDETGWKWFLDENADNAEISNQFADLQVFIDQTHDHHAAITANHPWYSYGLFYADYVDAIPGGYSDDFDNVEINACNAEYETYDTINSMEQLWNTFLNGGNVNLNGEPVETEKAHYLVGGSDTHDVLYPGFSGANYENVRNGAWYATGKIRTVAYVGDVKENDLMANGLAFGNACIDGHSYVTFGPLLQMTEDNIPGYLYEGEKFKVSFKIESLADIAAVYVLHEDAKDVYCPEAGYTDGMFYDKELSSFYGVGVNEVKYSFSMDVDPQDTSWVAFLVMDVNGNFAITNPYWLFNPEFVDVADDAWYAEPVAAMVEAGIIEGYEGGYFKPEANVTRAELATMLYRADAAGAAVGKEGTFSDVDGHWAAEAINAMAAAGIINGYEDGTFRPDNYVTRAEMAQMIYKAKGAPAGEYADPKFADVAADAWYFNAVAYNYAEGIIKGFEDKTFKPADNATRAQAAQIIYNAKFAGK